jgi:hypothetical protein
MTNFTLRMLLSFSVTTVLYSCGGGGGGGNSAFYGGVWQFQGVKVIDDCNFNAPNSATLTLNVNQAGDEVIADVGSLQFSGMTNDEDGFTIIHQQPADDLCETASAIAFKEASDGNANAGYAIVTKCRSLTCSVGYSGTAIRSSRRSLESGAVQDPAQLLQQFAASIHQGNIRASIPTDEQPLPTDIAAEQLAEQLLNDQ